MKRVKLILAAIFVACGVSLSAQNCIVVDSEKIFKSIESYNSTIDQLDKMGESYQAKVDERFKNVETLYTNYMAQRQSLSANARAQREQQILEQEKAANEYQESIFGKEGSYMKMRLESIKPIQESVATAIKRYARDNGYDLVLDKASNPSILFSTKKSDKTQEIINEINGTTGKKQVNLNK